MKTPPKPKSKSRSGPRVLPEGAADRVPAWERHPVASDEEIAHLVDDMIKASRLSSNVVITLNSATALEIARRLEDWQNAVTQEEEADAQEGSPGSLVPVDPAYLDALRGDRRPRRLVRGGLDLALTFARSLTIALMVVALVWAVGALVWAVGALVWAVGAVVGL